MFVCAEAKIQLTDTLKQDLVPVERIDFVNLEHWPELYERLRLSYAKRIEHHSLISFWARCLQDIYHVECTRTEVYTEDLECRTVG